MEFYTIWKFKKMRKSIQTNHLYFYIIISQRISQIQQTLDNSCHLQARKNNGDGFIQ